VYANSWADVLQVRKDTYALYSCKFRAGQFFKCPADKIWRLRRDYQRLELPIQLGIPYDLLEAANPDGLHDLRAGKTISLGKHDMQKACREISMCLQEHYATGLQATVLSNFDVPTGATWQVEGGETVFTVAQELSTIANKTIHPYDVLKYNIEVNPLEVNSLAPRNYPCSAAGP